jgi:hypothetical protein
MRSDREGLSEEYSFVDGVMKRIYCEEICSVGNKHFAVCSVTRPHPEFYTESILETQGVVTVCLSIKG